MLKNKLYTILSIQEKDSIIQAEISIIDSHPLFKGHFPDIPVLPGVTMMQIAKELVEEVEQRSFILSKASQIKFLQMLNPKTVKKVNWEIEIKDRTEGELKIKALMFQGESTFLKMSALLS